MAKVIVRKGKISAKKGKREARYLFVEDEDKDFHSHLGVIPSSILKKERCFQTKKGDVVIFNPSFIDFFRILKRTAQTINIKDIGYILINAGITKNSVVVDAGTGSGASACIAGAIAKKVYSYDIDESRIMIGKKNAQKLGLNNIVFDKIDIYSNKPKVKNADIFILDVPEPWRAFNFVRNSLKIGGIVVVYSPCITQVIQTVKMFEEHFVYEKTVELQERLWKVEGEIVRPENIPIGHTAFISFFRRVE